MSVPPQVENTPAAKSSAAGVFDLFMAQACAAAAKGAYSAEPTVVSPLTDTQLVITSTPRFHIVAFRGTTSIRDWITDARIWRVELPAKGFAPGCRVHRGFNAAFNSVFPALIEKIRDADAQRETPAPIILTGHSLGGALAIMAAFAFQRIGKAVDSVYTFGAPRIGDGLFARYYNSAARDPQSPELGNLWEHTFCFVNETDPVPRMPSWLMGYRRPGRDVLLPAIGGGCVLEPSLPRLLLSDAVDLIRGWKSGRLAALPDHFIDNYLKKVCALEEPA